MQHSIQSPSTTVFADQDVGLEIVQYLIDYHPTHLKCVVTVEDNSISTLARAAGVAVYHYDRVTEPGGSLLLEGTDYAFLAWWPKIIPKRVFAAASKGTVNLHPSFLPYDRGKNYNFWTLVEDSPFGVTMHFVDEGVDTGDILFQRPIEKSWTDTGGTLYFKAKREVVELFKDKFLDVISGRFTRRAQPQGGSSHRQCELNLASEIFLDEQYKARLLLNLLRARTFDGKPACYFFDGGKKYEVRISIVEADQ